MYDKSSIIESVCKNIVDKNITEAKNIMINQWPFIKPIAPSFRENISNNLALEVFLRDNFICRYCKKRTIYPGALRLITLMMPDEFPYDTHWKWDLTHPAYWELTSSCDHIVPVARGGSSAIENLATSCYMCNSIKTNWLLEELRWTINEPSQDKWDGLTSFFIQIMNGNNIKQQALQKCYQSLQRYYSDK